MVINEINYPYPVLSAVNDDYIKSNFEVSYASVQLGIEKKAIDVRVHLINEKMQEHLENGNLKLILHLESPRTSYREIVEVHDYEHRITIDPTKMAHQLEINCMIVSNIDIEEYHNPCFNPIYYPKDYSIKDLRKGSILAINPTQIINIHTEHDNLKKLNSVITVAQNSNIDTMQVNLDGDTIRIEMPRKLFEQYYHSANSTVSHLVLSSVIFPALIFSLDQMKMVEDTSLIWYRVIENKLSKINVNVEDINEKESSVVLAQKLLELPLERAFEDIERMGEE